MEISSALQLKIEYKSRSNGKNKKERVQELHLVEFTFLTQPIDEEYSSDKKSKTWVLC